MTPLFKTVGLALVVLAVGSAQASPDKYKERLAQVMNNAGPPVSSVVYHGTYSWEALGDHSLLLWETPQRAYFVDIDSICDQLPWENAIVVDFRNMTLDSKFDNILVGGRRCRIQELRAVDVKGLRAEQRQAKDKDKDHDD